jgi:hypothetical protein
MHDPDREPQSLAASKAVRQSLPGHSRGFHFVQKRTGGGALFKNSRVENLTARGFRIALRPRHPSLIVPSPKKATDLMLSRGTYPELASGEL